MHELVHWGATPQSVVDLCRGQLVYMATPYSRRVIGADGCWSAQLNRELIEESAIVAGELVRLGQALHAPVLQAASICAAYANEVAGLSRRRIGPDFPSPLDQDFWESVNRPSLHKADAIVVPDLPLWHQSAGVLDEVHQALRTNRRVFFYASYREGVI
jgi:hypothetical protein